MTTPTPLDAVTADDLLLDRLAARECSDTDEQIATMLLAAARQCDAPLRARQRSGPHHVTRRRTMTALAALGLAATGVGAAAAVEKAPSASSGRIAASRMMEPRQSTAGSVTRMVLPRPMGPGAKTVLAPVKLVWEPLSTTAPPALAPPAHAAAPAASAAAAPLGASGAGSAQPSAVRPAPTRPGSPVTAPTPQPPPKRETVVHSTAAVAAGGEARTTGEESAATGTTADAGTAGEGTIGAGAGNPGARTTGAGNAGAGNRGAVATGAGATGAGTRDSAESDNGSGGRATVPVTRASAATGTRTSDPRRAVVSSMPMTSPGTGATSHSAPTASATGVVKATDVRAAAVPPTAQQTEVPPTGSGADIRVSEVS
jgi:hypothetical protein